MNLTSTFWFIIGCYALVIPIRMLPFLDEDRGTYVSFKQRFKRSFLFASIFAAVIILLAFVHLYVDSLSAFALGGMLVGGIAAFSNARERAQESQMRRDADLARRQTL